MYHPSMISILLLFITILQVLEIFFLFLCPFSLCCSLNSIDLASSSLILSSVISTLVSNPSCEPSVILFFQFYNFYLIVFHNFYVFAEIFYFLFVAREFIIACWSLYLMVALKVIFWIIPTSDNSQCCCLWSFLFWVVIFLVLDMMSYFQLYPGHFAYYVRRV